MASLDDFTTAQPAGLDDFISDTSATVPVVAPASNLNLATHLAAMSANPDEAIQKYRTINSELTVQGKSSTADDLTQMAKDQQYQQSQQGLISVLSDPNVSDEEKKQAANRVYDEGSALYNTRNMLSSRALQEPSGSESVEQEVVRVNLASSINEINDYKRKSQEILNQSVAEKNPAMGKIMSDVVDMFMPFVEQKYAGSIVGDLKDNKPGAYGAAVTLLGDTKMSIRDMLTGLPADQRMEMTQKIIDAVNNNSAIVSPDSNEFAKVQYLQNVLDDGSYDNIDRWVDNATSILDLTMLGGIAARTIKKGVGVLRGAEAATDLSESAIRDIGRQQVRSQVQPTTVSQNYKDMNPEKAINAHEAAAADQSGEAAEAMYGTSRADAVGNDIAPEIAGVDGAVRNKVGNPEKINDQKISPNPDVMDFVNNRGDIYYDKTEKINARAAIVNDFQSAHGLVARKEMFNVESLPDGVGIKAIYGPPQGGFSNAQDAVDMAQWALRDFGIPDEAVTLLKREGTNYVPVPKSEYAELTKGKVVSQGRVELQGQEPSLVTSTKGATGGEPAVNKEVINRGSLVKEGEEVDPGVVGKSVSDKIEKALAEGRTVTRFEDGKKIKLVGVERGMPVDEKGQRWGIMGVISPEKGKNTRIEIGPKPAIPGKAGESITQTDIGSKVVVRKKTDYLIQVDHQYQFSPADMTEWSKFDVQHNWFDRIFTGWNGAGGAARGVGSLQRHLIDAASMFRPEISKGASVAIDRAANLEKKLIEIGDDFAKNVKKLPGDRQLAIDTVIREANERGLDLDYSKLVAQGFREPEIDALKSWREYWDTVYHLENRDAAKSLRNRGFQEFVDAEHDTKLFAKPIARTRAGSSAKVYDHTTGEIKHLNRDEISELYAKDGTLAQLRAPIQVGDDAADIIVNVNKAGSGYARDITNSTEVLAYRKGYYSVNYTDPHFIIKKVKGADGRVLYEKAVATAKTKKQADILTTRLALTDGGEYYNRLDLKKAGGRADDEWDIYSARGRSAQRTRGQRLEDTTSAIDPSQANIMSPVEALVHSATSISRRVELRDMIDAGKLRQMSQYEEFYPKGKFGETVYPGNITDIQYRGGNAKDAKKLADARSTFEYFKYLEDGYINSIDDTFKVALKFLAEVAGNKYLGGAEKAFRWMGEGRGPSSIAKSLSFNLYLALNPLRQFVVQGHQAVQLFAINPSWFLRGRAVPQTSIIAAKQLGMAISKDLLKGSGWTEEMANKVFKDFQDTGLVAAIDKQNLVRGSLINLADQTLASNLRSGLNKPLTWSRKVGFDAGEYVNTVTSYLSHYDQAFRNGADLKSQEVLQTIAADSRNFTYNMNAAGDLPYNQNALSAVFQFMQVPHKAMMTMTLNRSLTAQQKIRLAAFNSIMYTLPPAAMYTLFGSILPDDKDTRDVVVQGLEGTVFNKLLSLSTGEETNIDFAGLAPLDMFGTYEFIHSLFTTDVGTIISSTPGGQMLFGKNPRLTNFAKVGARYFNLTDDYTDPTTFSQVASEFAKLSSGYSNMFKSAYALKYKQKINTMGGVTDPNVSTAEAIAQAFGFGTMDEAQGFFVRDTTYKKSKAFEDDVKQWYGDYKKHLVREGITPQETLGVQKVYTEAWRHFGNDDMRAKEIVNQLLRQDVLNGDGRLYQNVLRASGIQSASEVNALIKAMPNIDEAKRQELKSTVDFINTYKDPDKE